MIRSAWGSKKIIFRIALLSVLSGDVFIVIDVCFIYAKKVVFKTVESWYNTHSIGIHKIDAIKQFHDLNENIASGKQLCDDWLLNLVSPRIVAQAGEQNLQDANGPLSAESEHSKIFWMFSLSHDGHQAAYTFKHVERIAHHAPIGVLVNCLVATSNILLFYVFDCKIWSRENSDKNHAGRHYKALLEISKLPYPHDGAVDYNNADSKDPDGRLIIIWMPYRKRTLQTLKSEACLTNSKLPVCNCQKQVCQEKSFISQSLFHQ